MATIVLHGGAGNWPPEKHTAARAALERALDAGVAALARGGNAVDAVVAAVEDMEDEPLFNAGTGSSIGIDGRIEMDACVMRGDTLEVGGVCNLQRVRHPVAVARAVMEQTDHVLVGGEGALRLARALGFADWDPETPDKRAGWQDRVRTLDEGGDAWLPRMKALLERHPELRRGTVGAVARDHEGRLAAATSTGGVALKLPGRIGDTPLPGAGTWADAHAAISATGRGELVMRTLAARRVAERVASGSSADEAVCATLDELARTVGADTGLIAIDRNGNVSIRHDTPTMAWARADLEDAIRRSTGVVTAPRRGAPRRPPLDDPDDAR